MSNFQDDPAITRHAKVITFPPNGGRKAYDKETGPHLEEGAEELAGAANEDEMALAFAAKYQGRMAFDHTQNTWMIWDGYRWVIDGTGSAFDQIRDAVRKARLAMDKPAMSMAKISFSGAIERAVRTDRRMAVDNKIWDRDQWILGIPQGKVDLRTGEEQEPDPDDFISRTTTHAPAPVGEPAPMWMEFLKQATNNDQQVIDFLQRFAGYLLTGSVNEEVMGFIYGAGGNGKGVFINTLTKIMGEYAIAMPIEAFTANSRVPIEYYRAQMNGARLVTASETEVGASWAESQIKELTGNEGEVSARNPYGKPFNYRPQFKLLIVGNHAPSLKGKSDAMERRLRVVPFNHKPVKPDHGLKERLADEYPAILRWMIDGCLMWQKEGLGTADAIKAATKDYFHEQDAFGRWLDECCIVDIIGQVKRADFNKSYRKWCDENGEPPLATRDMKETILRHPGLRIKISNGVYYVAGVSLKPENSTSNRWRDDE